MYENYRTNIIESILKVLNDKYAMWNEENGPIEWWYINENQVWYANDEWEREIVCSIDALGAQYLLNKLVNEENELQQKLINEWFCQPDL